MADGLPIYEIQAELLDALRAGGRAIVSAPTGTGKSTQVPQMLLEGSLLGEGAVVILQPRRLAARLLAARVARERRTPLGQEVGYQIRFENVTSARTRIRFVTEGVLLRQMLLDQELRGVTALIFDEFHERHLYGDVTLARALDVQERARPDLKLLVMSATLEAAPLEEYLEPCRTVTAQGRAFPVDIEYAATPAYVDKRPVWEQAAAAFRDYVREGGEGDVLIFMPGSYEISQTLAALRGCAEARGFVLLPLHGELPPEEQDAAVARYERRKVVVATNVAETSITIEGIRCVIDSGLARLARYDAYRGLNTLLVEKISRASADQRAGRAGRTAPGRCRRLWSPEEHGHRAAQELPEIKRLDLAEVVLALKAAGVEDLRRFRWLEPPEEQALRHAQELLLDLGALRKRPAAAREARAPAPPHPGPLPEGEGEAGAAPGSKEAREARASGEWPSDVTEVGRKMVAFPVHPRYSRMLLAAHECGCVYEACLVAALTQGRDLVRRKTEAEVARRREDLLGAERRSDFWALIRVWELAAERQFRPEACQSLGIQAAAARQVGPLLGQFLEIARREGLDASRRAPREQALRKCILIGFSDRVARRLDSGTLRCELAHGRRGVLARESVVQDSELFVAAEVQEREGGGKNVTTILSLATAIEPQWLEELFPEDLAVTPRVYYDPATRRVYAEEQLCFRGLAIGTRRVEPPPADAAAKLLAEEVLAGRLALTAWDHGVEQWILRLNLLSQACPELGLPPIGEAERRHLVEHLCHGAFSYKDIKNKPVKGSVKDWLTPPHQSLVDQHAPERLTLANGRAPKVTYQSGGPPFISVRIQELYGVTSTPRVALGRVPVLTHILAPNMRPVQITQDLAGFWREHYPRLKQELQRKYPKHEWR